MKVSDAGPRGAAAPDPGRAGRFGVALRRAREAAEAAAAEARAPGPRTGPRRAPGGGGEGPDGRREALREEARCGEARTPARASGPAPGGPEVPDADRLRAVLRALPLAIDASRVREGAPLSLALGRALDVELRAAPAGIEVVLRPQIRLARAAEAELPALVAALRARGIAVARAAVVARRGAPREGAAR